MVSPSSSSVIGLRKAARAAFFTEGQIEAIKWAGVVAMLIDHVNSYLLGGAHAWMFHAGRAAFPLFAVALAVSIKADPVGKSLRGVARLAPFAVLAQVGSQYVRDEVVLNILFLFVSAFAWVASDYETPARRYAIRALSVVVAGLAEFGLPGFFFVVSLWRAFDEREWWPVDALCSLLCLGIVAGTDGSAGALIAAVVIGCVSYARLEITRLPHAFVFVYVAQFYGFIVARWFYG